MTKRMASVLLAVALAAGVAACGSDGADQGSPDVDDTLPGVADGYDHPRGEGDVVIEYAQVGGFVPMDVAFQETPIVLVSGDGRVFTPGIVPAIFPGPLVLPIQVQTISDAGIQALLAAADEAGLLADVEYEVPMQIADASTARLTISVDGQTWVHEAYALGLSPDGTGAESSPERQALADFVAALVDLPTTAGADTLGEHELFEPVEYGIRSLPAGDPAAAGGDIEPTVEPWPADGSVRLADASDCAVVPASEVGELFQTATSLTWFDDAGITYQVFVKPILPGTTCG